jgi:chaperonin GroES
VSVDMIQPLGNRVAIRRCEAPQVSKGGIVLPEAAKEKPKEGVVVATGPGKRSDAGALMPVGVAAGDRVLFGAYAGTEVKVGGETLLLMVEDELLAVVKGA